jgi:arginyl-tRNA synthetase
MNLRQELEKRISAALVATGAPDASAMVAPTDPKFGDYKASGVMGAAKKLKLNPRELAQKVVALLRGEQGDSPHFQTAKMGTVPMSDLAEKIDIAGPGFINIILRKEWLQERLAGLRADEHLGVEKPTKPKTVVVDYSAPNLAKEMHVGHMRSTIIGDALASVLEFQGRKVIRQNHVGDYGTQFGMLIAYMDLVLKEGGESVLQSDLADLEGFYRLAKQRFDNDEQFVAMAGHYVVRLQRGDEQYILDRWKAFRATSMAHCKLVYDRFKVSLTDADILGESFYGGVNEDKRNYLQEVMRDLSKAGLLEGSQGATCVFLPQFKAKDGTRLPLIVQKSDEGYLYATTDLAAIRYRVSTLHADRILYVVDARQSLHFQMVFATARAAGFVPENVSLEHIAFGTMMGPDGKPFKTRTGGTVKLMDLLDEAVKRAYDLVTQKNADEVAKGRSQPLSEEQKKSISEAVGIGAVKYSDLAQNRNSDYVFSWDKMLAMDGNTAPYMQYAYARIKSIFRKGEQMFPAGDPASRDRKEAVFAVQDPAERGLAIKLLQFPETIATVAVDCLPSVLCAYLYDLAGAFTTFYENCPVLKSEEPLRSSRLALCELTGRTIKKGLELLGIATIEQM